MRLSEFRSLLVVLQNATEGNKKMESKHFAQIRVLLMYRFIIQATVEYRLCADDNAAPTYVISKIKKKLLLSFVALRFLAGAHFTILNWSRTSIVPEFTN